MDAPRRLLLAAAFALAAAPVVAAADPSPPPGWEAPPPLPHKALPKARPGKPVLPACCGHDTTCCERQLALDSATADRVARVVEVRFADLPVLVVKDAAAGGPPIAGAPPLRVFDGQGRPAPWPDKPKLEVRLVPTGLFGEVTWSGEWDFAIPFFRAPEFRGWGYGAVHTVPQGTDARTMLTGKVSYTTLDRGAGDTIAVDYVKGVLEGNPELVVSRWAHVEAAHVTDGVVHAFQGWWPLDEPPAPEEGKTPARTESSPSPGDAGPGVTFVLPDAAVDFESKDAKHTGAFHPRQEACTTASLPVGPGRSGLMSIRLFHSEIARWVPRPAGAGKAPDHARLVLASSQTSAEALPRVRVLFFAD